MIDTNHLSSHNHHQIPHVRKLGTRSHRPAPLRRALGPVSCPKTSPGFPPKKSQEKEQPEMATSFLNYCATCEKQINVPNNSILYCSESCRRTDSTKPLSMSSTAMASPPLATVEPESASPRAIVRPLTPTSSNTMIIPEVRIPTDLHDAKSDLDPTEWKPKLGRSGLTSSRSANSPAFHYLSQFHRSTSSCTLSDTAFDRPRHSTASITSTASAPSLATSLDTAQSSMDNELASPLARSYTPGYGEYDYATRALPPRHNPSYSVSSSMTKGLDLIIPHCAPYQASATVDLSDPAFQGGLWGKKTVIGQTLPVKTNEGLSALFGKSVEQV